MRYSWRVAFFMLLLGLWPQFGCVHLFGEKAEKDKTPDLKKPAEPPKQPPTAALDVTQQWFSHADALERRRERARVGQKLGRGGDDGGTVRRNQQAGGREVHMWRGALAGRGAGSYIRENTT